MVKEQFSYSKINTYNICPRKYEFSYIDFYPRKGSSDIVLKGTLLHKMIELYINDKDYDIPYEKEFLSLKEEDFNAFKEDFEKIKEQPLIKQLKKMKDSCEINVEQKLTNVFENFIFSGNTDTLVKNEKKLIIIDYKTGKVNQNFEQLEFYALVSSYLYPEVQDFLLVLSFVSHEQDLKITLKKEDMFKIENKLIKYISNINNSIKFDKKVGPLCNYCDYKDECDKKDKLNKILEDINYSKKFLPSTNVVGPLIYNGYIGSNTIILNDIYNENDFKTKRILSSDEGTFLSNILEEYKIKLNHLFLLNYNFFVDKNYNEFEDVLKSFNKEQFEQILDIIKPKNIIIFGEDLYKKFTNLENFEHNTIKIFKDYNILAFNDINTIIENFNDIHSTNEIGLHENDNNFDILKNILE